MNQAQVVVTHTKMSERYKDAYLLAKALNGVGYAVRVSDSLAMSPLAHHARPHRSLQFNSPIAFAN